MKRRSVFLALLTLLVQPRQVFAQGNSNGNANDNGNSGNGGGNANGADNGNGGGGGNGNSNGGGNSNGNGGKSNEGDPSRREKDDGELSESAALEARRSGEAVALQSILPDVRARTGGEVINAQLETVEGFLLYAVTVLTPDGKVLTEYYYARSGRHVE